MSSLGVQAPCGDFVDVVDLFEAHARRRPDACAVTCGAESITYAELDRRANHVAGRLARMGVEPGRVVALCLSRRIELLVGMLGILKAGAAYLPQDLVYPRERLAFMLEDASAAAVLTLSGDRHAIPEIGIPVLCLDNAGSALESESDDRPDVRRAPHDLAYVIYTSGSTGKPKGCQIDHANLVSFFHSLDREYDLHEDDTRSFFQSHAFDVSGLEIWGAFTHGARLVVVPHETTRSPEAFRRLLIDECVTVATETPSPHAGAPASAEAEVAIDIGATLPSPGAAPRAAAKGDWRRDVVEQQLDLMRRQIEWLSSAAPDTGTASAVAPASAPTAPCLATVSTAEPMPVPVVSLPTANAASREQRDAAESGQTDETAGNTSGALARSHPRRAVLTGAQRDWLDAFATAYVERTQRSKHHAHSHRDVLAGPRVGIGHAPTGEIAYPIVVDRSKGAHLWDIDGNAYVDVFNGLGTRLLGWQHDAVLDAVRAQLVTGFGTGPQHPLAAEVARLVCELSGHERAALCDTGLDAVTGAIGIARASTERRTVVVFAGSCEGLLDGAIGRNERAQSAAVAGFGAPADALPDIVVLDYGKSEDLVALRERGHEIAAVLVEPVQSNRPEFQPREYLRELRGITRECGSMLVFDERITGFRSDLRGAQGVFDVDPDLSAYGEVVGGGMPVGVIAGRAMCMDALDGRRGRFDDDAIQEPGVADFARPAVLNPLALAAAKAVLEHLRDAGPSLQQLLNARTAALAGELNAHCERVGAPVQVRYFASMWRIVFTHEHPLQDLLFAVMRYRGVHVLDRSPCFLTTAHSEADIAEITDAFRTAVSELQDIGVLARCDAPAHAAFDPQRPPRPDARLGRDASGRPACFVPNPQAPDKYLKVDA